MNEMSPVEELTLLDLDRSNKGASKQRRDQINAEIALMRDLLPLPESSRQRLSQLQIMSLSCVYIRKCNVLQKLFRSSATHKDIPSICDFFQALTGFLLITTREGKLVYISENVTDYLGHSMVDMKTQGDSLYDIVDKRDHGTVQAQLLQGGAELDVTRDVAFFCRMNMSRTLKRQAGFGDVKVMHVRGHFIPLSDPDVDRNDHQQQQKYVFMATCSPLITPDVKENLVQSNTMVFKTVHQLDMTFLEVTKTAEYHLGWSTEDICQKSWYSIIHPEDIHEAREKHVLLIRSNHEMGCMMTVRMLTKEGSVFWVNIVMHVRQAASTPNDDPLIVCINQVISEQEAYQIKVQSHMFALYPPRTGDLWSSGLSGSQPIPGSQPHPQMDPTSQWMPSTSTATPPVSGSNFHGQLTPYYVNNPQRPSLPSCGDSYSRLNERPSNYQMNPSPATPAQGQTDKLKQMLKRKIQGPCRPSKVPKLSWNDHGDFMGSSSRQGYEYPAGTVDPMNSPESAATFFTGNTNVGGFSWSQSPQMVSCTQYRMAHELPSVLHHQHKMKAAMLSPQAPGIISPCLNEQVVPESTVTLPDSYLTPDPSPASSPEPYSSAISGIKMEPVDPVMVRNDVSSSRAILQELEKLASLDRASTANTTSTKCAAIKTEKTDESEDRQTCRRKELPNLDAVDIESFFHTLQTPDMRIEMLGTAQSSEHKNVASHAYLTKRNRSASDNAVPSPKVTDSTPGVIKTESVPVRMQQLQVQDKIATSQQIRHAIQQEAITVSKKPAANDSMDSKELEALLSFFSGEMTATQLDLTTTLTSACHESDSSMTSMDDGDALVESAKAFSRSFGFESSHCNDAAHLGASLRQTACLERRPEEFSPMSCLSTNSDLSCDAGDEDSNSCDDLAGQPLQLLLQAAYLPGHFHSQSSKIQDEQGRYGKVPTRSSSLHGSNSQDLPGLGEEDELYQLDRLLALVPDSGAVYVSAEPQ